MPTRKTAAVAATPVPATPEAAPPATTTKKVASAKAPGKEAGKTTAKPTANASAKPAAKPPAEPAGKRGAKPGAKSPAPTTDAAPPKPKQRLVRDSFTIPKTEYAALDELKRRAAKLDRPAKKGELLRAGIKSLSALSDADLLAALKSVPTLKTGRPKHD